MSSLTKKDLSLGCIPSSQETILHPNGEEPIVIESVFSLDRSKYIFTLPYEVDVGSLMTVVTNCFSHNVLQATHDRSGGRIILNELGKHRGIHILNWLSDCFCLFRMDGSGSGPISRISELVTISITKQIINQKCIIKVSSPFTDFHKNNLFHQLVLEPLSYGLRTFFTHNSLLLPNDGSSQFGRQLNDWRHHRQTSPSDMHVLITKKVFDLLITGVQAHTKLKSMYQKEQEQIAKSMKQLADKEGVKPIIAIQSLIKASRNLFWAIKENQTALSQLVENGQQQELTYYAIETALCMKFYTKLVQLYIKANSEECLNFNQCCSRIKSICSKEQYFEQLELEGKFRLLGEEQPYLTAIEALKKIGLQNSPRSLLLIIQKMLSAVKVDCLVASCGVLELSSMDVLLPVFIYVTARAGVKNFPAYLRLMDDYVRISAVFQLEERTITTFFVAVKDIFNRWKQQ